MSKHWNFLRALPTYMQYRSLFSVDTNHTCHEWSASHVAYVTRIVHYAVGHLVSLLNHRV